MRKLVMDPTFLDDIREKRREQRDQLIAKYGWPETVNCARCGDHGLPPDSNGFCTCVAGERLQAGKMRREDWERRIPRRCWDFTVDSAPDRKAAAEVAGWLAADPFATATNLVLAGEPGTGKTGLAVGALRRVHDQGIYTVRFANVPDWLELMRPSEFPERRAHAEQIRRSCEKCGMLCLDDLGAEKPSEWVTSQVYAIINSRYDAGLPVIVTTNATRRELSAMYGDRVVDRIVERAAMVGMDGVNLRRS